MLLVAFVVYFLAGIATFAAFILSLPRRRAPGGRWLALALLVTTLWMWSNAVLHTLFPFEVRMAAAQIALFGGLSAVLYFYFAIEYASPGTRVDGWRGVPLLLLAMAVVTATFVPAVGKYVWLSVTLDPGGSGIYLFEWGPAYFGSVAVGLALTIMSITQVWQTALRTHGAQRRQALIVLVGLATPIVFYALAAAIPGRAIGWYPAMSMGLTGLAIALALQSVGLLKSVPVGRREFVDTLVDGFLVTDLRGEVVDANPAAARILVGDPTRRLIGRPYEAVLSGWLCNGAPCAPERGVEVVLSPVDAAELEERARVNGVRAATRVILRSWDIDDVNGEVIGSAFALRDDTLDEVARRRLEAATSSIAGWTREMTAVEELLKKVR